MTSEPNEQPGATEVRPLNVKPDQITFRILLPLVLVISILLAAFIFVIRLDQQKRSARDAERSSQAVQKLLRIEQEKATSLLVTTLLGVMQDGQLADTFRARDRQGLLERTTPLFEVLKARYAITHFYFELPDRTVLLRMHDPVLQGDRVDRVTMLQAERSGKTSAGVEHGVTGNFTLRVVTPWRENGELIGYLELGMEFENIVQTVQGLLDGDADFIVAIDKKFLDRTVWDKARKSRGEGSGWEEFPSRVIINKTVDRLPAAVRKYLARPQVAEGKESSVVTSEGRALQMVFLPLIDVNGDNMGRIIVYQDITAESAHAQRSIRDVTLLCLGVGGILIAFCGILLTRIERTLAERTSNLEREIRDRTQAENQLREAQRWLVETSRRAGMAEVATSVLHNVGNVLNSVNVASSSMADSLRSSKTRNLAKVVGLLREHESDLGAFLTSDPKGKQIPSYLAQLANYQAAEQETVLKELAGLQKNIEHIKDIVTMQQGYAKVSGIEEPVRIAEVVDDALRMNASGLVRHDVQVVRECADLAPVILERSKVMQILVNLISNAKYACDTVDRPDKCVMVRASNGANRIRIEVSDNGIGIPPENLDRIFAHGFTTRKEGHGFGLHSAALAAQEMGGELTVESAGPNQGASFILELPVVRPNGNGNGNGK